MENNMPTSNPYTQYMYSYPHKTAYRTLTDVHLKDYISRLSCSENSLYFHIPFCQTKCGYCNLFSVTGKSTEWMQSYVDAMEKHAKQLADILPNDVSFQDLTLGGGTPLILSEEQLCKVFTIARNILGFEPENNSIIIETSPNQTTLEKLALLKKEHVNRISIGVQSFHDNELSAIYRMHNSDSAKRALHDIKNMDFDCVNIDLIYGIPGQTTDSLLASLTQALKFEPDELFVYPLYVKPGTLLHSKNIQRLDEAFEMYKLVHSFLKKAGYHPHSMRRFVKDNVDTLPESLCGFGNTISIGCGGRSYVGNLHFCTPYAVGQTQCLPILNEYIAKEDFLNISHGFFLNENEEKRRYVIKHILFGKGINRMDYKSHYHQDVLVDFPLIKDWIDTDYATINTDFITLTEEGFALSDYLGPQLISSEVMERSTAFYKDF